MAIEKYKNAKKQTLYRASVYINRKKVCSKRGFKRLKDAESWHNQKHIEYIKNPNLVAIKHRSFEELTEKFSEFFIPKLKPQTQDRYFYDLKRITPHFKFYRLDQITTQAVSDFQSKLMNTKVYSGKGTISSKQKIAELKKLGQELPYRMMAPKSINHCLGVLCTMFNYGIDLGWMHSNPSKKIKKLTVENRGLIWWKDEEDIRKFLDEVKNTTDYYAYYLTTIQLGLRLGEVAALKKIDFDFRHRTLSINEQWNCKHKQTDSLKGNQPRVVSVNEDLAKVLKEEIERSLHPTLIFSSATGNRVSSKTLASRTFYRIMDRAGVPRISFHGLRHTYAFHYIRNGGNIRWLQENLGHQFIETTEQYAHQVGLKADSDIVNFANGDDKPNPANPPISTKNVLNLKCTPNSPQKPKKLRIVGAG